MALPASARAVSRRSAGRTIAKRRNASHASCARGVPGRQPLEIRDEYDVQYLLHALLRVFYDDIREEPWTLSYAGGASRIDFFLRKIGTAVETKMARPRKLGDELMVDIERYSKYPDCRALLCLVYDPNGLIPNPRGLENDLSEQRGELAVHVVIAQPCGGVHNQARDESLFAGPVRHPH
jgi:REase_DpnII-MboI